MPKPTDELTAPPRPKPSSRAPRTPAHRLAPLLSDVDDGALRGSHDGSDLRIAVLCARFNDEVTTRLLAGALRKLKECNVAEEKRLVAWVPGSFELPLAAQAVANLGSFHAIVCLGAIIRGETAHFEFVAGQCAAGLQRVQLETKLPIAFGVLTTEDLPQALERSGGSLGNKGEEAVETAIEMVRVLKEVHEAGQRLRSQARTSMAY
ncbi:MAG TPA: 6,7-dimethyl-8-ribityllumazine synthase [Acidimicrobiales bacterium]|nr:6,7-dimethyl-8-ribityllumazine synthase [Acidimicrobiales bacterium]